MIKNYIFDFGNVLAEFYPDRLTAPYVSDPQEAEQISAVAFDRLYWNKLDRGEITDEEVHQGIRSRLPGALGDKGCLVYDSWVKTMTPVPGMQDLIAELKQSDKKLFLLSNISVGFANTYKDVEWIREILDGFDGVVLSGVIGMGKPDKEIFEYVLSKFNLKAEESLFIDDAQRNIDGACQVGIHGYLFDGDAEKLRNFLLSEQNK